MIERLTLSALALAAFSAPAFAHEIAAGHAHAGPLVLLEWPLAIILVAAALAVLGMAVFAARMDRESDRPRHDPR